MVIEANRDAARECVLRAKEVIKNNDITKMQKLLRKAKQLDPDCDVNSILVNGHVPFSTCQSDQHREDSYSHDDHYNNFEEADVLRNRKTKARSDSPGPSNSAGRSNRTASVSREHVNNDQRSRSKSAGRVPVGQKEYTSEEVAHVDRIRHCHDYYEILQLSKTDFTETLLKRKYRELALKLHPDKCKAPGSTEAFKALGNAYAVLSDPKKREDYDRFGMEQQRATSRRTRHSDFYDYDVNRGFESEMSPEDIFEMFFGGGFPSGSLHRRRAQFHFRHAEQHQQREEPNFFHQLLQILPILIIIFGGLLVQFFSSDPIYSLTRDNTYHVQRYTRDLRVPYFVRADFEQNYGNRLHQVEQHVENDYVSHLRTQCYREKSHREGLLWTAKMRGDSELWRRAQEMELVYCRKLEELYR